MKKLVFILAISALAGLSACGQKTYTETTERSAEQTAGTVPADTRTAGSVPGAGQVTEADGMTEADNGEHSARTAMPEDDRAMADVVSVGGPYGQISAAVPKTWCAEAACVDSGKLMYGLYGLILKPKDAEKGQIELFYADSFGVCGTGLSEEEIILAGKKAHMGTYDNREHWDFITYEGKEGRRSRIVAQHTDCSSWTEENWAEALSILDTVRFDESKTEGGAGQYIPESEDYNIAVMMSVSHVTPGGCTVHLRQYDKRAGTDLNYGEAYTLERLAGDSWEEVPQIIEDGAFTDIEFSLPPEGEAEIEIQWEWLYGKLDAGTYRITKTVWDTGKGNAHVNIPLYLLKAQFYLAE
ncbi:MAG: hypothetical protein IJ147_05625 [Lachnospiraceae bacterium]|nr:hypothetical protein [Lachnospiraceae bacterium]